MHGKKKTLAELFTMLASVETEICRGDDHRVHNSPCYQEYRKADRSVRIEKGIYDIHVIDIYLISAWSNTWVFDTGSVAHICNSQEELQNKRDLEWDEVRMRVGNG